MRESEDHVEFKKGEHGNVSYNGCGKDKPQERRRCILGYVAALCNEGAVGLLSVCMILSLTRSLEQSSVKTLWVGLKAIFIVIWEYARKSMNFTKMPFQRQDEFLL